MRELVTSRNNTCSVWAVCEANFETSVVPSLSNDRECSACPSGKWADYGNAACKDIPLPVGQTNETYFTSQRLFITGVDINVNKDNLIETLGITLNSNIKNIELVKLQQSGDIITVNYRVRTLKDSQVGDVMKSNTFTSRLESTFQSLDGNTIVVDVVPGVTVDKMYNPPDVDLLLVLVLVGVGLLVLACVWPCCCHGDKDYGKGWSLDFFNMAFGSKRKEYSRIKRNF